MCIIISQCGYPLCYIKIFTVPFLAADFELYGAEIKSSMIINKYLERIGDHMTNIAEWVIFSIEGSPEL